MSVILTSVFERLSTYKIMVHGQKKMSLTSMLLVGMTDSFSWDLRFVLASAAICSIRTNWGYALRTD